MIRKMYSVHNQNARVYFDPTFYADPEEAVRAIIVAIGDEEIDLTKLSLWYVGDYDSSTGKFILPDAPVHELNFIDLPLPRFGEESNEE